MPQPADPSQSLRTGSSKAVLFFHLLSYLQYPLLLVSTYFVVKPYLTGFHTLWENYNIALIFAGIAISFSTLQDTTKTQNAFSRRIWEHPRKGKIALAVIALMAFFMLGCGLFGILAAGQPVLQELSFGILVLGIGFIGLLKAALEMFENHRMDRVS